LRDQLLLRVLFNNPNPGLHGGPATHLPLLKAALERYVEVESFRHGRATDSETTARKMLQTALNLGMVESKILRRRPDIIHVNSSFNARGILRDAPLAWVAKRHAIPVLLKAHGSFLEVIRPTQKVVEAAKKSLIRNISLLCVLSSAEKQEFEELLPELKGRVSVVKNIISDRFLDAERRESDQPLVLFASRFLKEKGPFDLLDAVPNIVARIPEARFVFLGDGPDASAFDAEINKRGVGVYVQRMPHADRNEIAAWYTRSWVFVFPTLFPEGMPMVIAEAMATGTPIVMTQIRFGLSYMAEYDNCLYCKPRNPESIAQQVIRLLTDSAMRQKMSQANRILALQFETDAVAREFVQIYEMLASAAEAKPVSVGTGSGRLFKS
jgi:glycosyltransferase involved in cell wall biosynthesis